MSQPLGTDDYREGAFARLGEAQTLLDDAKWVGAMYLAGRAVECMLRSLLWMKERKNEAGHDLRLMLRRARSIGMIDDGDVDLENDINEAAIVWHNNLRFIGEKRCLRDLRAVGRDRRVGSLIVKGDPLKTNASRMFETCSAIVARGEVTWKRFKANSKVS